MDSHNEEMVKGCSGVLLGCCAVIIVLTAAVAIAVKLFKVIVW